MAAGNPSVSGSASVALILVQNQGQNDPNGIADGTEEAESHNHQAQDQGIGRASMEISPTAEIDSLRRVYRTRGYPALKSFIGASRTSAS